MGFRRPLALLVLIAAAAPFAVLSAPQTQTAAEPATAATTAPAASASAGAPAQAASAAETAEAEFSKLAAVKTQPGDPKAGQAKAAACGACHGMDGNSTDPQYPKLADQNEQYIVTQLMRFKSGVRVNAIMAGMAAALSPQDMHDIAAYFAGQKRLPGVTDEKLAGDGEKLYREGDASRDVPACMACHGPDGAGNPGWRVPNVAGQHADYVQAQLKAWHDGTSWGSDAHAEIMPTIAQRLTEHDISAVSSYVEGLHAAPAPQSSAAPPPTD
ncbi:MAG TPA: c-type cytochrome [Rhodanobacteraceae bacterium]|jgi:cytochrome c553|nr:c-type cytochrome [Rhodanobacteraceae bacterium]